MEESEPNEDCREGERDSGVSERKSERNASWTKWMTVSERNRYVDRQQRTRIREIEKEIDR